ncbi:MAG: hypothetical protein OEU90_07160 [Gammaproteobacteria bacterium]|nr:hypothetical protein [Gammaproteobacteria bacterium]MDH3749561.1 hypothetical protein [Gammaproteobacteria bacterium]MDH3805236.1 hypothetical protein [Gammaproteobacteria bacterium]
MDNSLLIFSLIAAILLVVVYNSIKIAQEDERFATFVLGRFAGYKGPGLILTATPMRVHRLKVGDLGVLTSPEFAEFGKVSVPVRNTGQLNVGDSIRIAGFEENWPLLVSSSVRPTQHCPQCGHQF